MEGVDGWSIWRVWMGGAYGGADVQSNSNIVGGGGGGGGGQCWEEVSLSPRSDLGQSIFDVVQ